MKKGFTLTETLIVLTVIGIIFALVGRNAIGTHAIDEKKLTAQSRKFYTAVDGVVQKLVYTNFNGSMKNMKPKTGNKNADATSSDLKSYFVEELGGKDIDCSKVAEIKYNPKKNISKYLEKASCAEFDGGVKAGFMYYPKCDQEVFTSEYYGSILGTEMKSCGYVLYAYKNSKGDLGLDTFIIPINETMVKDPSTYMEGTW